ncbi:hypothetical protein OAP01_10350 [Akkermansiaceae bacterium]|nr:hypothetical protein [Akkermansiaceae bacterium]
MMGKSKFTFTIIDDTDDSTLENTKPIYDFLYKKGILITKTVWVYPPRDDHSFGDSLQRKEYLEFIKDIKEKGFEIALHNVGSGSYDRSEILNGLEEFKMLLGDYPNIHINHSYNPDSIYGGSKRFNWPFNKLVNRLYPQYAGVFEGEIKNSKYFWGDKHKDIIEYSRNHEIGTLNTTKFDPLMPYIDPKRNKYCNYWFSATFAPNQLVFNHLVNKKSINKLERENGTCILFTHLGYFMKDGKIDEGFKERIDLLSKKTNGSYIPLSLVLDNIKEKRVQNGEKPYPKMSLPRKFLMEILHLLTRIYFRKIVKIDDYSFKNLDAKMFRNK